MATNFANSSIVNDLEPGTRSAPAKKKKFVVEESANDRLMILEDVVILVVFLQERKRCRCSRAGGSPIQRLQCRDNCLFD